MADSLRILCYTTRSKKRFWRHHKKSTHRFKRHMITLFGRRISKVFYNIVNITYHRLHDVGAALYHARKVFSEKLYIESSDSSVRYHIGVMLIDH